MKVPPRPLSSLPLGGLVSGFGRPGATDVPAERGRAGRKVFGFAGYSGSGKTTLIEQLIPRLVARGLTVSLIKHAHHSFDIDKPGKDSWRHREAGATEVLLSSRKRWALMHELRDEPEPGLDRQLLLLSPCDLVLVEGYKTADIPKIEVHRPSTGNPLLHPGDPAIVAVACDMPIASALPVLALDDVDGIAAFILRHCRLLEAGTEDSSS